MVRWLGWIIVGSFVAASAMGQLVFEPGKPASLIPLVLMVSFGVFMIVAPRRAIKKVWRSTPLLHESVEGSIDSEGLRWKTESSDMVLSWDKMIKAKLGSDLILLYTSLNQALIMPRSYFANDHDWRSAREIAEKRVSRG